MEAVPILVDQKMMLLRIASPSFALTVRLSSSRDVFGFGFSAVAERGASRTSSNVRE
jgi:hypothetical protein